MLLYWLLLLAPCTVVAQELLGAKTLFFTASERELHDKKSNTTSSKIGQSASTLHKPTLRKKSVRYKGFVHVGKNVTLFFNRANAKRYGIQPVVQAAGSSVSAGAQGSGLLELVESKTRHASVIRLPVHTKKNGAIPFNVEAVSENLLSIYIRLLPDGVQQKITIANAQ